MKTKSRTLRTRVKREEVTKVPLQNLIPKAIVTCAKFSRLLKQFDPEAYGYFQRASLWEQLDFINSFEDSFGKVWQIR